ncbi:UNVERIFIED_CONTAM: Heparan-alpha-glucosaminide N-acetyltransferase [Sesamum calycinum]|uniref:Heparan-alpha-glucosaminide N-acetyltransferase n=1 Tax=Sesamum calycinum TaxID=2727403 RepID=A0AAW2PQL7_9LAMI
MTDIKEDVDHHRHLILPTAAPKLEEEKAKPQQISKPKRVASLDIFRGLTVALMILVDDAGGEWPVIGHAPWNGCNFADFVMPFFLFIVGMAIPLAFKEVFSHAPDKLTYGVDMKKIRWCGILQRIALAYIIVAFVEIATRNSLTKGPLPGKLSIFKLYLWHWMVGACVLTVYLGTLYGTYVPDWQFTVQNTDSADFGKVLTVACNVRGKLDPPCNAVGYVDRKVLGINHMYPHPAWKRSKLHFCYPVHNFWSSFWSCSCTYEAIPLNKQLYTLSYVCVTSGAAALVFSAFYVLVDIWNFKYPFLPLEWIGMNAMLVYVMAAEGIFAGFVNGWYYDDPHNTLIHWIQKHIFIKIVRILEALTSYSSSASQLSGLKMN